MQKLRHNSLKKQLKDLQNIKHKHFREFFSQVLLHSEAKKICYSNDIKAFDYGVFPCEALKFLSNVVSNDVEGLHFLSVLVVNMQPTDIFNFFFVNYRKVDFLLSYFWLQIKQKIYKLQKNPFKFKFFKLKVIEVWGFFLIVSFFCNSVFWKILYLFNQHFLYFYIYQMNKIFYFL